PATSELSTLSLHAALPISRTCLQEIQDRLRERPDGPALIFLVPEQATFQMERALLTTGPVRASSRARVVSFRRLAVHVLQETGTDRKSTRLNSSHVKISYA